MPFDPVKTAQKLGVAREYRGARVGNRAMLKGKGTWALKPKVVSAKYNKDGTLSSATTFSGGGVTGKGKLAAVGGGTALVGGTALAGASAYKKKKEPMSKSAFGVDHIEKALTADQKKQKSKYENRSAAGIVGGAVATTGGFAAMDQNRYHVRRAKTHSILGTRDEALSGLKMGTAKTHFDTANRYGKGTRPGNHAFGEAAHTAREAGQHLARSEEEFRSAGKSMDTAKKWKRGGAAGLAAGAGLYGVGIHQAFKADNVGKKPKAVVAKSAFGVEHIEKRGDPKVKWHDHTLHSVGPTGQSLHKPSEAYSSYEGKSLIMRRPKYEVNTMPSKSTHLDGDSAHFIERRGRRIKNPANIKAVVTANKTGSKTLKTTFGSYKHETVKKSAFGVEHPISKAIRVPNTPKLTGSAYGNAKVKTMTGHLKRAGELGVKPKGSK